MKKTMDRKTNGRLLTRAQAAERLGRSEWSVGKLIRTGRIPEIRADGVSRIEENDLNDYINHARRRMR